MSTGHNVDKEQEEELRLGHVDPVVVVGSGIAGVSFVEAFSQLCPAIKIVLVSTSALLKVARNLTQTGIALEQFDVSEEPKNYLESAHKNVSITLDKVISLNAREHELVLSDCGRDDSGGSKRMRYSKLCICTGARPHLIPGANEYVIGIRDTETVKDLQRRLIGARRIIVVGNGGIATELVHEVDNCQVIWAIKDKSIGNSFFDPVAAHFFAPKLSQTSDRSMTEEKDTAKKKASKRLKYVVDDRKMKDELGSALGPDWVSSLNLSGSSTSKDVLVEHETEVKAIFDKKPVDASINLALASSGSPKWADALAAETDCWPVFVELTNGKIYGCDFIVSATGVTPNTEPFTEFNHLELAEDGGIKVNNRMATTETDVFAAGDVCHADWPFAEHWFQMRLWTQARQMGAYAAYSVAADFVPEIEPLFHFNFEVFTHVTQFFGAKVILLGLFNGQKLNDKYEALYRVTEGEEYVKVLLKDGKMKGAVLIGETDLEETFENLIHNQIDLSRYGEDLLNSTIDIEDYFD